jgi:uncharacterized protein (UPF0179 family)
VIFIQSAQYKFALGELLSYIIDKELIMEAKIWEKTTIKEMLLSSNKAVLRGVVAIYERQTAQEQSCDATMLINGVGFSGVDAELLSSFARQIKQGRTLSDKQMEYARKKIMKYAGQLTKIANHTV